MVALMPCTMRVQYYAPRKNGASQRVALRFAILLALLLGRDSATCQTPGALLWQVPIAGGIQSSPAVADAGTIYLGVSGSQALGTISTNGWVYSISPQGTTNWIVRTYGDVISSPAIGADGSIYVGSDLGYLYAFRPNGTTNWIVNTGNQAYPGYITSSPAIGLDGTIYITSSCSMLSMATNA
jgi:outer membrane protein assembly factor BamB